VTEDLIRDFIFYERFFSEQETKSIIDLSETVKKKKSGIHQKNVVSESRKSESCHILPSIDSEWLFRKLEDIILLANCDYFGFEISGFEGGLELISYKKTGDYFDWHPDRGFKAPIRKLSFVVQLSPEDSYSGCNLELMVSSTPEIMPKSIGTVVIFPSFVMHRVSPLVAGLRQSLVGWITGPSFR